MTQQNHMHQKGAFFTSMERSRNFKNNNLEIKHTKEGARNLA